MSNPESYTVPFKTMETIYEALHFYANITSYQGERTGGVLQGCPRGPAPTPDQLVTWARLALEAINKDVLHRSPATTPEGTTP